MAAPNHTREQSIAAGDICCVDESDLIAAGNDLKISKIQARRKTKSVP